MSFSKIFYVSLFITAFSACSTDKNPWDVDVSSIPAEVKIIRFDLDFYGQPVDKLPEIKQKYPYMFSSKIPDSIWRKKMQDSLILDVKKQVDSVFPDLKAYEKPIAELFKHIKYYHKDFKEPDIITLYSDWNYMMRAIYADSLEILPLDNYLGPGNPLYKGIPQYIKKDLKPQRIPLEIAISIADVQVKTPKDQSFLHKMIYEGKKLVLLEAYLPGLSDEAKIGYTPQKWQWAKDNEKNVWQYFVEKKLLYSYGKNLDRRFLRPAPYSKFYSEEDLKSPGRIGSYIGWQIVRSFMQKNKVSLQKMIEMPEEEIFKQSKYKPAR